MMQETDRRRLIVAGAAGGLGPPTPPPRPQRRGLSEHIPTLSPMMQETDRRRLIVVGAAGGLGLPYASAVVGSMVERASETLIAGKPPRSACWRIMSSFGAM